MNTTNQLPCTCTACPGAACTCGCQLPAARTPAAAATPPACACGTQCRCGAACACAKS